MKSKRKTLVYVVIIVLMLAMITYGVFLISKSRSFQFFGGLISRVNTNEKIVALTFDDAPTEYTDEVLQILSDQDIRATFYALGESMQKYPDLTKKIVQYGNELGNHSYSHQRFLFKSQSFIENEIQETNTLIRDAGYNGEITFRPPNGKKLLGLPWYLNRNKIKTIMWDIEPDTKSAGHSEQIQQNVMENIKPGSIILMHPFCEISCQADRDALPKIIRDLKDKGYVFVTISELLKI